MKTWFALLSILLCCGAANANAVTELSQHLGEMPALVAVICQGEEADVATIANLVEQTPWKVFCQGATSPGLDRIRNWARQEGLLGGRIFVVDGDGESLWLAGDLADAVWVAPGVDARPIQKEIMRVLRPGGVCAHAGKTMVKPAPVGTDEWRHPYHDPDNNVVSRERVSRLPGELRFQTYPVFAAMPNQTLFAGGRIFFFSGHIAFHEREEPLLNKLTVLNAYNGLKLWSQPLDPDYVVHNISKLATDSEVVFAEGPTLRMLDATTGRQRGTFSAPPQARTAGDTDWKWIALEGDVLFAAFGPPDAHVAPHRQKRQTGHWPGNVANDQYRSITNKFGAARRLAAYRYPEMEMLWSVSETDPFDARALCIEGGRIFELAPGRFMAARDCATGEQLWRRTPQTSEETFATIGSAIKRQGWGIGWATYCWTRASDGVVCIAGPSFRKTLCINFETGDLLWATDLESPHPFF
ncbi:MAG: class I SAM-dependent methyltransferase, partial [Planctomycetota bacterium]